MSDTAIIGGAGLGAYLAGENASDLSLQAGVGLARRFQIGKDLIPMAHAMATYEQVLDDHPTRRAGLSLSLSGVTPLFVLAEGGLTAQWNFQAQQLEPGARFSINAMLPLPDVVDANPVLGVGVFAQAPDLLELRRDGMMAGVQVFVPVGF